MRRSLTTILCCLIAAPAMAACSSPAAPPEPGGRGFKVCEVVLSRPSNPQLADAASRGLSSAEAQLGVSGDSIRAAGPGGFETGLNRCARQEPDLIIAMGSGVAASTAVAAAAHSKIEYALIDTAQERATHGSSSNLVTVAFAHGQAAFLAGFVAAGSSLTGRVATFGDPLDEKQRASLDGFAAGVSRWNQETGDSVQLLGWDPVRQVVTLGSSHSGVEGGGRAAQNLISRGADILFTLTVATGTGAAQVAERVGNISLISAGQGPCQLHHDYCELFFGSTQDRPGSAVAAVVRRVLAGPPPPRYRATLTSGSVTFSLSPHAVHVPDYVLARMPTLVEGILIGEVPVNPRAYLP